MSKTTSKTGDHRRIAAGHYAVIGTDLEVKSDTYETKGEWDCDHPLCHRLHPRKKINGLWVCAKPCEVRTDWVILHNGERHGQSDRYATKREAIEAAKRIQRQYVERGI